MLENFEIIFSPIEFFKEIDKKTFKEAFWWSVIISYIGTTLLLFFPDVSASAFFGMFLFAGFVHIFVVIFSGKLEYSDTYKIVSFSSTVFLLMLWTMILSGIFQIWSHILIIIGIVHLHKKRKNK